jgi:hypothetical protein
VTPIKNISINPRDFKNIQKEDDLKRIRESKTSKSSLIEGKGTIKVSSEKVNISATGKKMLEQKAEVSRYFAELKDLETLDQKSSAIINNKIDSGFYSKPSVMDKLSDAILALPIFSETHSASTDNAPEIEDKSKQLSQIKQNLENGIYDSDEVLDVIVDRLSDFLENDK